MAITEAFTGTATIGTTLYSLANASTTLTPRTEDGVYQVFLDFNALALADQYEVTILERVTSGGAQREVMQAFIYGPTPAWVSPSLILLHGWDVQVRKLAGTDRSVSWSIRRVA